MSYQLFPQLVNFWTNLYSSFIKLKKENEMNSFEGFFPENGMIPFSVNFCSA